MEENKLTPTAVKEAILNWKKDTIKFVRDVIKPEKEDKKQFEVLEAIPHERFISVKSAHGVGKTTLESWITLWFLTCFQGCRIPITAPTEDQLTKILWPEIYKWLNRSELKHFIEWTKSKVFVKGEEEESFAVYRTASTPEALQGFHANNLLFILEEASGIEDAMWNPVEGAMTTENVRILCFGNPTRPEGNFYRTFTDQSFLWKNFTIKAKESSLVSSEYVERMAKKYGVESDVYAVRVEGEFPKQNSNSFIPLYLCERSLNFEIKEESRLKLGVDVARFGDDYTVFLIRGGGKIKYIEKKQGIDTMETVGKIQSLMRLFGIAPEEIFVDVIGIGAGVVDRLYELKIKVNAINAGEEPLDKEMYFNKRAELWGVVKNQLEEGKLNLKYEEQDEITQDLSGELCSPRYKFTSKGQYQLESKEEMKKRGIQSPNLADSLCLTFSAIIGSEKIKTTKALDYGTNY